MKALLTSLLALLLISGLETSALAQAVEFDLAPAPTPDRPWGPPFAGPDLAKVSFYELSADGDPGKLIYSEVLGYVSVSGGVAHLIVGSRDPDGFQMAFGLLDHPDANLFAKPLWVVLEECVHVEHLKGADRCDERRSPAWRPWIANRLEAAPLASTVLSVPLKALPNEVVLGDELERALAAERAAWEAAVEALKASVAAEAARAAAAEAALGSDLAAETAARAAADAAEAASRRAADDALATELTAVEARRAADAAAASSAITAEIDARVAGDAATLASASDTAASKVGDLASALATAGSGALVAWNNITGRPAAGLRLTSDTAESWATITRNGCILLCEWDAEKVTASCPAGMVLASCSSTPEWRIGETYIEEDASGHPQCSALYDHNGGERVGKIVRVAAACIGLQ